MSKMITRKPMTFAVQEANKWYRAWGSDYTCDGSKIANQEAVANYWVCPYEPKLTQEADQFYPGAVQYDDRLPWQDEVWVMSDTAGATISFQRIYIEDEQA